MTSEERIGRFTIRIDPRKKAVFEHLCELEDVTPSQVVRQMIRAYIEQKLGRPWVPGDTFEQTLGGDSGLAGGGRSGLAEGQGLSARPD